MANAVIYPPADRSTQWFGPGNSVMPGISKLLLHTTETAGWPGYSGGASAPTLTYHPQERRWRQHFPLNHSARALRDPSGTVVKENRDNIVQVEIVCSCDRAHATRFGIPYVTSLSDAALDDLGEFAAFLHAEWGLPLVAAQQWPEFDGGFGQWAGRMSGPEFDAFRGVLGHMHASGNDHGDPGNIRIDRIMTTARGDDVPISNAEFARIREIVADEVAKVVPAAANAVWNETRKQFTGTDEERSAAATLRIAANQAGETHEDTTVLLADTKAILATLNEPEPEPEPLPNP